MVGSISTYKVIDAIFDKFDAVMLSNTSWPAQLFPVLIVTVGVCADKDVVKKNRKRITYAYLFIL
jgi:hypothetical protein